MVPHRLTGSNLIYCLYEEEGQARFNVPPSCRNGGHGGRTKTSEKLDEPTTFNCQRFETSCDSSCRSETLWICGRSTSRGRVRKTHRARQHHAMRTMLGALCSQAYGRIFCYRMCPPLGSFLCEGYQWYGSPYTLCALLTVCQAKKFEFTSAAPNLSLRRVV